jgi:hypothetical protein
MRAGLLQVPELLLVVREELVRGVHGVLPW